MEELESEWSYKNQNSNNQGKFLWIFFIKRKESKFELGGIRVIQVHLSLSAAAVSNQRYLEPRFLSGQEWFAV